MVTDNEIADFIGKGSGDSLPAFKFKSFGDKITGTVTRRAIVDSTDLNDATIKVKSLVLDIKADEPITQVQTDGTSVTTDAWSIWIKPSQLLSALAAELKAKGADAGRPREGDRIAVEYYDAEPPTKPGRSPKKLHRVQFKAAALATVQSASDLL